MVERSRMTEYMRWLADERGLAFDDYAELWRWSVDELEAFWASIWDYFDVQASGRYERVLASHEMPGAKWFSGAELNYAEHVFRDRADGDVAILHASELRDLGELTWGELRDARSPRSRPACAASGSSPATASSPTCRTSPRRSSPSSPPPRSGRSGRAARPTSAPAASSTASPRSSPRSCSRSTATATAARTSTAATSLAAAAGGDAEPASGPSSSPTSTPTPTSPPLRDAMPWAELRGVGRGRRAHASSACPSTTRSGSSTPRAPPGCRRRSSRATAGSCSST